MTAIGIANLHHSYMGPRLPALCHIRVLHDQSRGIRPTVVIFSKMDGDTNGDTLTIIDRLTEDLRIRLRRLGLLFGPEEPVWVEHSSRFLAEAKTQGATGDQYSRVEFFSPGPVWVPETPAGLENCTQYPAAAFEIPGKLLRI